MKIIQSNYFYQKLTRIILNVDDLLLPDLRIFEEFFIQVVSAMKFGRVDS